MSLCGDAPDTSGMNAAAVANAEVAKEALAWYKQAYADQAPLRDEAANIARQVSSQQLSSMQQNDAISKDYWNYQKNTFRPLEQRMISDAQTYNTPARQEAEAAKSIAGVGQQAELARQSQMRGMQRMGVNPASGKMLAMGNQMSLAEAGMKAGAANTARNNVELQGYARMADAANMGRNLASNQATSAGISLNAGNNAAQTGQMPMTQAQNATNQMAQGFNTAIQGNNSAGNIYGSMAQIQGQDSGIWGALGGVAGQFLGGQGFANMVK
jgi:hypothetical protein